MGKFFFLFLFSFSLVAVDLEKSAPEMYHHRRANRVVWRCAARDVFYENHYNGHWGWGVTAALAAQYAMAGCQIHHGKDCGLVGCRWSLR